ncbi:MAG: hypothetical protein PHO89_01220 [Methylacidiphilaceae bacterium]|nr:hypothetical protein [Candidatus Methylacidiphilaceae bacterium]
MTDRTNQPTRANVPAPNLNGRSPAVALIVDNRIAARVWMIIALVAMLLVFVEPAIVLKVTQTPEKAIVLGAGREVYMAPIVALKTTDQVLKFFATEAVTALLTRSGEHPVYPEQLKSLFNEAGLRGAQSLHEKTLEDVRGLHVHPEISKIAISEAGQDEQGHMQWAATVTGALLRQGRQGEVDVADSVRFRVSLLLVRNLNLGTSGMVPYLVERIAYREIDDSEPEQQ